MIPHLLVLLALLVGTADSVSAHQPAAAPAEIFAGGIAGPEGLALTRDGTLVVGTITGDILLFEDDGSSVFPLADGIALDGEGNVLVVNADTFKVILADTGEVQTLPADPLLDWPTNLAFGRRRFGRRTIYLANYGPGFGDGTTVVRLEYNHRGARLSR
jgi:sugar lactone lactonase YvrE